MNLKAISLFILIFPQDVGVNRFFAIAVKTDLVLNRCTITKDGYGGLYRELVYRRNRGLINSTFAKCQNDAFLYGGYNDIFINRYEAFEAEAFDKMNKAIENEISEYPFKSTEWRY